MGPLQCRGVCVAEIIKGRSGIFFTFIAISIMAIFILVFVPRADISLQKETRSLDARIGSIDNYVEDLENRYLESVLRASTQKAIMSLIYYMNTTGSFLTDLDSAFKEVMVNGTLNGVPIDSLTNKKIMENSTLYNWSDKIIQASIDTLNVNTTITINNVSVSQTKPWNIDARLNVTLSVKSNVAEWNKDAIVTATLNIEGFYDPYYLVKTNGLYANIIKKSSVEFNKWNITLVREHLRNGTYVHWTGINSSSFLMRFTNMSNSTCCGIESLTNPNMLSTPDRNESYVDYLFWAHTYSASCSELYNITNPQTGGGLWDEFMFFKLDVNDVVRYNITAQDAVRNC